MDIANVMYKIYEETNLFFYRTVNIKMGRKLIQELLFSTLKPRCTASQPRL